MQNATSPDVDLLMMGGESPRRRRSATLTGGIAVALLLIGGGAYAGTHLEAGKPEASGITGDPTTAAVPTPSSEPTRAVTDPPSLPAEPAGRTIEPGTYRLLVGFDRAGAQIDADLSFGTRDWLDGNFPIVRVGEFVGGVGVYQPHGLAGGSGCSGDRLDTDLGRGGFEIPRELADLPRSTVLQPLTPVRAFGHDALHLRFRIRTRARQARLTASQRRHAAAAASPTATSRRG